MVRFPPAHQEYIGRSELPVYQRQFFPDPVLCEPRRQTRTLFENEGVRMWELQDGVAVASLKSKANTIGQSVIDGLNEALHIAEQQCQGLIIYQNDENNFCSVLICGVLLL